MSGDGELKPQSGSDRIRRVFSSGSDIRRRLQYEATKLASAGSTSKGGDPKDQWSYDFKAGRPLSGSNWEWYQVGVNSSQIEYLPNAENGDAPTCPIPIDAEIDTE